MSEQNGDAESRERLRGALGQRIRESSQHMVAHLDQEHAGRSRLYLPEFTGQGLAGELGDLPGHLDSCRPRPYHHEGQPGLLLRRPTLGGLECRQDPPADLEGAVQRLDLERVRATLVVAEVGVVRSGGDDVLSRRYRSSDLDGLAVHARVFDHHYCVSAGWRRCACHNGRCLPGLDTRR